MKSPSKETPQKPLYLFIVFEKRTYEGITKYLVNRLPGSLVFLLNNYLIGSINPIFHEELESTKNEGVNQAANYLKVTASKACDTLIGLLDHPGSESVRHRVTIDLLYMTPKHIEFKGVEQQKRI